MEWIKGEIWANVYMTDTIIRIDPQTGAVTGAIDMSGLLSEADVTPATDVLNGIAYDARTGRIFVTGKNWNKLFELHNLRMLKFSIHDQSARRILILDGGLGTMIQGYGLSEEDYRGTRFADWKILLKGCNDLLVLTRPQVIAEIHEAYLKAGADIISTDTFNASAVSMADYGLEAYVYEMNRAAAALARKVADGYTIHRNRAS